MKRVGLVTLYFMICFALVLTLKKLFLAQYDVEFYGVSAAVIGALVAGKVVVLLEHTRLGTRFDQATAVWPGALYKTGAYTTIAFLVVVAEKAFHAYRESGELGESLKHVWEQRDRNVMLATVVCIGLAFAGFNLYSAVDRRLGAGSLRRLIWGSPQKTGTS